MERSWWLCVVRLITLARCCSSAKGGGPMRPLAKKEVRSEAQVQKQQLGPKKKTVSKRSLTGARAASKLPETSHERNRQDADRSVIIHGLPKI